MRKAILFFLLLFLYWAANSQNNPLRDKFFRLYIDNDAINFPSNAHDWGYTSGNRIDIFYSSVKTNPHLLNWLNESAGTNAINTSGWGLMQLIIAPKKTSLSIPDKNDYPYSGALFVTHTANSRNSNKKINLESEWLLGLMGPPSFAKESHTFFHTAIGDPLPLGWDYQLPTDLLLNYNLRVEKQLTARKNISLIGGGELFCGSMTDGLSLHLLLQIGKNRDYFGGLTKMYFAEKKPTLSMSAQATADIVFYNALLEGGFFNKESPVRRSNSKYGTDLQRQKIGGGLSLMLLYSARKFAISLSQKTARIEFKKYRSHLIGNISVYIQIKR